MTHIETLKTYNACDDAVQWASQYPDFATAWDACQRPDWMLWLNGVRIITITDRDLRLFACDCVRYTPIGDGRTVWDLLDDERSRNAVEVAERYANGDATQQELNVVWGETYDVLLALASDAVWYTARAVAEVVTAWHAARVAASAASWAAAAAVWTATGAAVWTATGDAAAARAFQADLLRKRVGNPFL